MDPDKPKQELPDTITINGVEYVRKNPQLKYQAGDMLTLKVRLVSIDPENIKQPYKIRFALGDIWWISPNDIVD